MIRLLPALAAALSLVASAHAHRQPEVEITVEVLAGEDATPEALGITHRLHAHDAMTLLRALGEKAPSLEDERHLARLSAYAADALVLTGEAASTPLGAEVEGNYVFVYVRHPEVADVTGAALLDGVVPGWTNTVHVKDSSGRTAHSVTFDADRARLAVGVRPIVPGRLAPATKSAPPADEARP